MEGVTEHNFEDLSMKNLNLLNHPIIPIYTQHKPLKELPHRLTSKSPPRQFGSIACKGKKNG